MKKSIFILLITITLALVLYGCGDEGKDDSGSSSSSDSVKMMAHTKWPDDNFISDNLREFKGLVSDYSDGNLELDVNTGGQLGFEGPELLAAVRDNTVPLSDIFTSEVGGEEPLFLLTTMPFIMADNDELVTFYEVAQPYFEKILEEKWNQKFLFGEFWPYAGFYTQSEVNSIEDMAGMNMRTYDQNGATVVEKVGGTPMPMPFSEVYSSLSTGVIDSVLTSSTTGVDGSFWEVLKYHVPTNVTAGYSIVTINLDEFNKLDEQAKEALVQAGQEMNEKALDIVTAENEEMLNILEENGMEITEPSQEFMNELSKIGDEITDKWLENEAPPEAIEIMEEYREKIGR